jgi:hypothetical protein
MFEGGAPYTSEGGAPYTFNGLKGGCAYTFRGGLHTRSPLFRPCAIPVLAGDFASQPGP